MDFKRLEAVLSDVQIILRAVLIDNDRNSYLHSRITRELEAVISHNEDRHPSVFFEAQENAAQLGEVKAWLRAGQKIRAIKLIRAYSGCGLVIAKDYAESKFFDEARAIASAEGAAS